MTNQLITYRLPIDYSLISLMSLMSSISYVWQKGIWYSVNSNGPGLEQAIHRRRVLCQSGLWLKGFSTQIPNSHSWPRLFKRWTVLPTG